MYFFLFFTLFVCGVVFVSKKYGVKVNSTLKKLTLFFLIMFCVLFCIYDKKGTHYGLECTFCSKTMPYNLKPRYYTTYPQRFYLLDEDGYELIGIGFKFRNSDFKIKDFLSYGYNDTSVIVKCTDSLNNVRYLISYETSHKSSRGNPVILFRSIDNEEYNRLKYCYQWIEINKEKTENIRSLKITFVLGILFFMFLMFFLYRNG